MLTTQQIELKQSVSNSKTAQRLKKLHFIQIYQIRVFFFLILKKGQEHMKKSRIQIIQIRDNFV